MAGGKWRGLRKIALRRKSFDPGQVEDTKLRRCLSRWDLTALGVGSTLGVGVYVLIGQVALSVAGPSIVLSFLIAAVASLLAGLCFAEFSTRIPKAGAAYNYTYVALGEIVAFLIGWCNILECVFGSASVARGLSMHMDDIFNSSMTEWFAFVAPITVPFMSPYFDIFAFLIVLVMGAVLSFGVREVSLVNNLFSAVNMAVIVFIIAVGAFAADSTNWSIPLGEVPVDHGMGGFFPFGIWGTLRGAAICFYGFVGFDSICAAGEEAREPRRVISMTIVLVILVTAMCYISVSVVVTMMVPYYFLQGPYAAVSDAFLYVGWNWARWIVSIGSLFGLYASLFGAMFPLPRLLYSMSSDGFFTKYFSKVTELRQSPMIATIVPTIFIAILAGLFDVSTLVATMCTGTLFSYTAVATGVIIMRYQSDYTPGKAKYFRQVFGIGRSPTMTSTRIIYVSLVIFICIGIAAALVLTQAQNPLIPCSVLHALALTLILIMAVQPQIKEKLPFKTPLVPLMPCLSIYFNIHLMTIISGDTWIRAGVWIALGIIIYLMTLCCCKREESHLKENMTIIHGNDNCKAPVQIIVESPTPPDTIARISNYGGNAMQVEDEIQEDIQESVVRNIVPIKIEEVVLHQAYIEDNEEKEAKIIDLLDQVLQAEEDTYGEVTSIKDLKEDVVSTSQETEVHRKSLSELSDAGSDASLGSPGLSKYDVVVQVHREDLPKLNEEEEKSDREEEEKSEREDQDDNDEQVTAFNDSDSRTDESGYSDTLDRNALCESLEESREDIPYIPVPPPLPDLLYLNPNFKEPYIIASKHSKSPLILPPEDDNEEKTLRFSDTLDRNALSESLEGSREDIPYIPVPPPIPDLLYLNPNFKKSHTIASKHLKPPLLVPPEDDDDLVKTPRESIKSNSTTGEDNITFGSNRQMHFMSKLNNIFQTKITGSDDEEPRQRSHSTGNVVENTDSPPRPVMFLALQNEINSKDAAQNLRQVNASEKPEEPEEIEEDLSMARQDLKSKLEGIFAAGGGTQLVKPRLIKSNPPALEEQTDTSSTESIPKLPKMEKNDTLKRHKDKFSAVLNSFRLSFKDDDV